MSDPSFGSPSGDGGPSMIFCHQCGIEAQPLMAPDPTCPRCNGQFVEVIEQTSGDARPQDFDAFFGEDPDEDDTEATYMAHTAAADAPFSRLPGVHVAPLGAGGGSGGGATGARPDLGGLIQGLLSAMAANRAAGGQQQQQHDSWFGSTGDNRRSTSGSSNDGSNSGQGSFQQRQGTSQFGPLSFSWNFGYGTGSQGSSSSNQQQYTGTTMSTGGECSSSSEQTGRTQTQEVPPLADFLRNAFGPRDTEASSAERQQQQDEDSHFHDDGIGGAGSASDGRRFNHDNQGGRSDEDPYRRDARRDNLPPELAGLRNLFTGLFGGNFDGGGLVFDLLGGSAGGAGGGGRGQWGDYVLGQHGLDDIISQLMEQTQSSNAPPPAGDEEINKLERFKLSDTIKVAKAKNRDCPTCNEDFLTEETSAEKRDDAEDPPEDVADDEPQQEDLAMMPCNHLFHKDCLVPWLKMHGTCPVCRISIVKPQEGSSQSQQQGQQGQQRQHSQEGSGSNDQQSTSSSQQQQQGARGQDAFSLFGSGDGGGASEPAVPGGLPSNPFLSQQSGWPPFGSAATGEADETQEQRRERMRRAAEVRQRTAESGSADGGGSGFLEPDELD